MINNKKELEQKILACHNNLTIPSIVKILNTSYHRVHSILRKHKLMS